MELDLQSYPSASAAVAPWPTAWTVPSFPPSEREDLRDLQRGDVFSDRMDPQGGDGPAVAVGDAEAEWVELAVRQVEGECLSDGPRSAAWKPYPVASG